MVPACSASQLAERWGHRPYGRQYGERTPFCSSRGLTSRGLRTAITRTALAATADGIRYSMSGASPPFARLWPRYWPDGDAPSIHRTTAAAVLSAVVLQADLWNFVPTT